MRRWTVLAIVVLLAVAVGGAPPASAAGGAPVPQNAKKKKKKCKKAAAAKKKKCRKAKQPAKPPAGTTPSTPANLSINPASKNFGMVTVGMASAPQTFVVTNSGGQSGLLTFTTSGTDAAEFKVSNDLCSGRALATGGTCTLDVKFMPPGPPVPGLGPKSGVLTVEAPGTSTAATLTGFGSP